ncbi:MAG: hypothetical protein MZV63_49945 [Marinilabiliales bacterium]|nr:hypothetical protein [Marinilabiliales bacterium]
MTYSGLELGTLAGIKDMERISGSLDAEGRGFSVDSMNIIASVTIDTARYRGYNYHGITVGLDGAAGLYSFAIDAADTSLKCNLEGMADLGDSLVSGSISGFLALMPGDLIWSVAYRSEGRLKLKLPAFPVESTPRLP